jgi:hypothetical protein
LRETNILKSLHSFSFDRSRGSLKHIPRSLKVATLTVATTGVLVMSTVKERSVELGFADAMAFRLSAEVRQQHSQHESCEWHFESFEQNEGRQQTRPLSVNISAAERRTFEKPLFITEDIISHYAENRASGQAMLS